MDALAQFNFSWQAFEKLSAALSSYMLTWNFVLQLALITAAFGLALKIAGYFPGKIANWVKARTDDDDPWLRRLGRTADTLLVPTIWVSAVCPFAAIL